MEMKAAEFDVIVLGAGASGLMCALEAGKRSRSVLIIDHAKQAGLKIRISGGGRCNFTNTNVQPHNYLSQNSHFCKSALSRFTQWDFFNKIKQAEIPFEERSHGQLFGKDSANGIVEMLLSQCRDHGVTFWFGTEISGLEILGERKFTLETSQGNASCESLVVATGGLSYPSIGASALGYDIAQQVGIPVVAPSPALVPFTLSAQEAKRFAPLSGIAVPACVSMGEVSFSENLLFTHRGLSGPVILQISSYWKPGQTIRINMLPGLDLFSHLKIQRGRQPQKMLRSILSEFVPKRLLAIFLYDDLADRKLVDCSDRDFQDASDRIQQWKIIPAGTEGYKKAEATRGGVDCDSISSKTMEALGFPGLFFIGEVLDVTGWLGGYNLQWAWSSGWCAGQYV